MESQRRSHKMSEENWAAIDTMAKDLGATATTGRRIGLPSWRSLLYQIATGKLVVVPADTLSTYRGMFASIARAINYLLVAPEYLGAKRHILARLRAVDADGACGQHDL